MKQAMIWSRMDILGSNWGKREGQYNRFAIARNVLNAVSKTNLSLWAYHNTLY